MAKKRKTVSTAREAGQIFTSNPLALNQWCIEMAMRWPVHEDRVFGPAQGGVYTAGGGVVQRSEANIIDRANRIMGWVKQQH